MTKIIIWNKVISGFMVNKCCGYYESNNLTEWKVGKPNKKKFCQINLFYTRSGTGTKGQCKIY